jgi:peptidoglycan/LPS O-acetylase OafA/YrhL
MAIGAETNVKWVDGLRGLASVLVVITHIYRQFDDPVFDASMGENKPMRWDQWPFMSFAGRGRVGVTIFAFVTGYVCALKPIKLYRAGNQESAFVSISKSAIRRFPRLMLPAAAATVVAWVLAELGLYTVLKHSDNYWLAGLAHDRVGTAGGALYELGWQICKTWVQRENNYDNNQWTMLELLQESYKIYIFLIAVAYLKPRWRMASALLMMLYEWCTKEGKLLFLSFLPTWDGPHFQLTRFLYLIGC